MPKRKAPTAAAGPGLRTRIERALEEGRSKQALDLAKTLFREEPTPEIRQVLRRAYLARGRQLREIGETRDSINVLKFALDSQGDDPDWLALVGEQLALSGAIPLTLELLQRIDDASVRDRLVGQVVDAAMQQQAAGRAELPESYQADFDRIIQAFALCESGQDEQAREILGGIGLRSPFLEWKLLLRGLIAYYANDDARALENWQRLSSDRLPARLAAPFRQMIDPPFRAAQPAAVQAVLRQQFDRSQSPGELARLRELRTALIDKENLAPAFRVVEALLPELRKSRPALIDRLARVFYWAITESGPDDISRYLRVFGRPPADPQFNRLQAVAYEKHSDFKAAHRHWQKYEEDIAANPAHWPEGNSKRARALIWVHMGRNAAHMRELNDRTQIPQILNDLQGMMQPLKPDAEACFERAIALAPDLLEPYEELFCYCSAGDREGKAIAAGKKLLKQFPDHVATLEALASLYRSQDKPAESLELYERALRGNPLDRSLRDKTINGQLACARLAAVEGRIARARDHVEAAAALAGGVRDVLALCRAAAIELKAGELQRSEELQARARQLAGSDVLVSYRMLADAIRLNLGKSIKMRFDKEFNTGLTGPASGAVARGLVQFTADLSDVGYPGQKNHQKKVFAYLERAKNVEFTESDLHSVCKALVTLSAKRPARYFLRRGQTEFPNSPFFPYLEAMSYLVDGGWKNVSFRAVEPLLERAERLARALPATDQLTEMLEEISRRRKQLQMFDPIGAMFGGRADFDVFFGVDDDDDDF